MVAFAKGFTLIADTITISAITGVQSGSSFTVSGSTAGFVTPPVLAYEDDGGSTMVPITGNTATTFSFIHPGVTAGNHTLSVFVAGDPTHRAGTASYTVTGASGPGPPTAISLISATSTTLMIGLTPPDQAQTYTYNVAYGTVGLGGPFPSSQNNLPFQFELTVNGEVTFITLTGLTRGTSYFMQITAVAPGNILGTPSSAQGPFATPQVTITINPITALAGSSFLVSGTFI